MGSRKSIRIGRGVYLNFGKRGTSITYRNSWGTKTYPFVGIGSKTYKGFNSINGTHNRKHGLKDYLVAMIVAGGLFLIAFALAYFFVGGVGCMIGIFMSLIVFFFSTVALILFKDYDTNLNLIKQDSIARHGCSQASNQAMQPILERQHQSEDLHWAQYAPEIIATSKALLDFLREIQSEPRFCNIRPKLNFIEADGGDKLSFSIDRCLAMIVYCDMRDVFLRLGYSLQHVQGLEGLGFCTFFVQLLEGVDINLDLLQNNEDAAKEFVTSMSTCDYNLPIKITIADHENEFRFVLILCEMFGGHEWITRYLSLIYRWAFLIANADGKVTNAQWKVLKEIESMGNGELILSELQAIPVAAPRLT